MATFNRFNGDAQPVFALDIQDGSQSGNIGSTDALVQPQGPKLDFFKVLVKDTGSSAIDLRDELGGYSATVFDPGVVQSINTAIQGTATIAMYQVEGDNSGQISYALYPTGAYTASTLQTALQALGTVVVTKSDGTTDSIDVSGTTVTEPGLKLA